MELTFNHNGKSYLFDTSLAYDISLSVMRSSPGANCFYTDKPIYESYSAGNFVGNVALGGACNVDVITFTPHGNGTHTECIGHLNDQGLFITESLKECFLVSQLISISPKVINQDLVITLDLLLEAGLVLDAQALIVRTLPNYDSKKIHDYSGTNPTYFAPEVLQWLTDNQIKHLLCDIPSVDREDDGGQLLAHKAFFGLPKSPRLDATITELIYAPSTIIDGYYMLNLQIAPFQSDASPSRPLLFSLKELAF